MGIASEKDPSGLFIIRLSGIFTDQERKSLEDLGRKELNPGSRARILILCEGFAGWAKKGDWGDLSFMNEHDPFMEKIAVVAAEKWRDEMLMFLGAGLRDADVRFFTPDQENMARAWLG